MENPERRLNGQYDRVQLAAMAALNLLEGDR